MAKAKKQAQIALEDRIISNSELLALLEEREHLKEAARATVKTYREKDKQTQKAIEKLNEAMPYRCGEASK